MPRIGARMFRLLVLAILIAAGSAATAAQRSAAPTAKLPKATLADFLRDGDHQLAGTLPSGISSNLVAVRIDTTDTATKQFVPATAGQAFSVRLTARLRAGQTVDVKYFANGEWSEWSDAVQVQARAKSDLLYSYDDDDNPFEVSTFLAASMDQFAASEALKAAGLDVPGSSNSASTPNVSVNTRLHMTAGFDMAYRIAGHAHSERQVWIFSRAIYAVRSGEELCTQVSTGQFPCIARLAGADALPQISRIIEDAKSFETISGVRVDLTTLQAESLTPVKVYVSGQIGALLLEGAARAKNQLFLGPGLRIPDGAFKETRVESGLGYSQVFETQPGPRWKVHAFFAFPIAGAVRGFAEIRTDADLPHFRTISMFTVLGVHYEIGDLMKR